MKKILTYIDPYTIAFISILIIIFSNLGYFIWNYNILIPFIITTILVFIVPYIVIYGIKLGGMLIFDYSKKESYYIGESTTIVEKINVLPIQVDAVRTIKNKERTSIFKVSDGIRVFIDKNGEVRHIPGIGLLITLILRTGELNKEKIIKLNYNPFLNLLNK